MKHANKPVLLGTSRSALERLQARKFSRVSEKHFMNSYWELTYLRYHPACCMTPSHNIHVITVIISGGLQIRKLLIMYFSPHASNLIFRRSKYSHMFPVVKQLQSMIFLQKERSNFTAMLNISRPVLAYGSETWVLSKSDEARIGVFERKVLRAIFGPTNDNGECRIKYNDKLYTLYKDSDIITYIKISSLIWAGHVIRLEDQNTATRVFLQQQKEEGQRADLS